MPPLVLSLDRLKYEFREAKRADIRKKFGIDIFPSELWYSREQGLGLFKRSVSGLDFGVNRGALSLVKKAEDNKRIRQGYALLVDTDGHHKITAIVKQLTIQQLCDRLRPITPIKGKFGEFNWVDENGNPVVSDVQMPFTEEDPEDFESPF